MSWGELSTIFLALAAVLTFATTSLATFGKLAKMTGIMEVTLTNQNVMIADMKSEIKALANVVTQQAIATIRLDSMGVTIIALTKRVDELAHGEGFVFPLTGHFPSKANAG